MKQFMDENFLLDTKTAQDLFHNHAAKYEIVKENSGVKIEYSGYSKQVEITIEGGYDPSSTGTDLTKRDVAKYVTH